MSGSLMGPAPRGVRHHSCRLIALFFVALGAPSSALADSALEPIIGLHDIEGQSLPPHRLVPALGRLYLAPENPCDFTHRLGGEHEARLTRSNESHVVRIQRVYNPGEARRVYRAHHEMYGPLSHRPDDATFWRIIPDAALVVRDDLVTAVRDEWLVDKERIMAWHAKKDEFGPAITGSRSWHQFMDMLDSEFRSAGLVDMRYNRWTFDRWVASTWPDDTDWSLHVDGQQVEVANAGANSGSTPSEGVSAPLVVYDFNDPPVDLEDRIVVFATRFSQSVADHLEGLDYEYRSDPDTFPERGGQVPEIRAPQSWQIFPQLMETREFIQIARDGGAAGALFVFDAGADQMAGMYTFPVPDHYDVPTLLLDRDAGATVKAAADAGGQARLRLNARIEQSEAYQIVGVLPGRDYGTPEDEMIKLTTHTDGPSISQDNGALGLLAVVRYMARVPRAERPRSLLVFLDSRHFMPGAEEAFAEHDFVNAFPELFEQVRAIVGMEHLGQVEFQESLGQLERTGRVDTSLLWTTDHDRLIDLAVAATMDNDLPATRVLNVARPGLRGESQGDWYGMAKHAPDLDLPGVAIMGTMGVYWAKSSGLNRVDPRLFRDQVASFVQIIGHLMKEDLETLR